MKHVKSPDKDSLLFEGVVERVRYEGWGYCSMNERALLIIVTELSNYPDRPYDNSIPDLEKEEITFSKWILGEILDLVWEHPWTPASETIENLALKLQFYLMASVTEKQKRIFSIAFDTTTKLLKTIKEVEK